MSVSAIPAQGTTLHISGTAATPEVLTAITAGFPTILAITGHAGVANGDVVTLAGFTGADAAVLNGISAVVKNYATGASNDTFAIDVNTVGKTITIDAGNTTATPTAWIKVGNVNTMKPSGSTLAEYDVTDLDSTCTEVGMGIPDMGTLSLEGFELTSDVGQAACAAAHADRVKKSFKVTYPSGTTPVRTFDGFVKKIPDIGDIAKNGPITGTIEIRRTSLTVKS